MITMILLLSGWNEQLPEARARRYCTTVNFQTKSSHYERRESPARKRTTLACIKLSFSNAHRATMRKEGRDLFAEKTLDSQREPRAQWAWRSGQRQMRERPTSLIFSATMDLLNIDKICRWNAWIIPKVANVRRVQTFVLRSRALEWP